MKKKIFTMFLAIILVLSSSMIGNANESIVESKIQPKKMSQEIESDFEKFINFVEKNLEINNNRYVLKNIESIDTYIQNNFENISRILNVKTKDGNAVIISEEDYNGLMETLYSSSIPGMKEKVVEGLKTSVEDCIPEDQVEW